MPKKDFLRNQGIFGVLLRQSVFQGKNIKIRILARKIKMYGHNIMRPNPI